MLPYFFCFGSIVQPSQIVESHVFDCEVAMMRRTTRDVTLNVCFNAVFVSEEANPNSKHVTRKYFNYTRIIPSICLMSLFILHVFHHCIHPCLCHLSVLIGRAATNSNSSNELSINLDW